MTREMLSRIVAAILFAFPLASFTRLLDRDKIARMQTLTPQQYYDAVIQMTNHSFTYRLVICLVPGIVYIVAIEALAFTLRRGWRHPMIVLPVDSVP
jgi:hypothetical protein